VARAGRRRAHGCAAVSTKLIGCRLDVDCFAASARDPFGNLLCLIHNPNFKLADERQPEILACAAG